ncbi:triacylglycerol lipase [Paenibacillus sp. V4I5]|uniref:esterase/lipase family protein n=1 Tax=Paenibacillus sp. V4I5 TaxID=3042306 RepID=UPI00278CDA45|nr:hypothetical protein [Paenibacillus sp. V4I5]MDQ0919164.1 hypothetical protein [Paenibacillus sp. V4I5]
MKIAFYSSTASELKKSTRYYEESNSEEIIRHEKVFSTIKEEKFYTISRELPLKELESLTKLPTILIDFLKEAKAAFRVRQLPFFLVSLESLLDQQKNSFNKHVQEKLGDNETIFFHLSNDIEAIHELDLEKNDMDSGNYDDSNKEKFDLPKELFIEDQKFSLKYISTDITKMKDRIKKIFLFIKGIGKKVKSIIGRYNPRYYEIIKDGDTIKDRIISIDEAPRDLSIDKPMALIVHGFASHTEENFEALKKALCSSGEYQKVFGFSYPPNREGILKNGAELRRVLQHSGLLKPQKILDIFAHSEGGLVTRSMIQFDLNEENVQRHSIRNYVSAGSPHAGTPITELVEEVYSSSKIALYICCILKDVYIDRELFFDSIKKLEELFTDIFRFKFSAGLRDMTVGSKFLQSLNTPNLRLNISGDAFSIGYRIGNNETIFDRIKKRTLDYLVFKGIEHDGVVPFSSSRYHFTSDLITIDNSSNEGWHSDYFDRTANANYIVNQVLRRSPVHS